MPTSMSVGEVIGDPAGYNDYDGGQYDYYKGVDPSLARGSDLWMEANQSSARLFEKTKISVLKGEKNTFLMIPTFWKAPFLLFSSHVYGCGRTNLLPASLKGKKPPFYWSFFLESFNFYMWLPISLSRRPSFANWKFC